MEGDLSDSYQAVYDAVRSRISSVDPGQILNNAAREAFDISHIKPHLLQEIYVISEAMTRPSVLYRPTLSADGTKWMALLGDDLAVGVAGFGDTPDEAMRAFDNAFQKSRTPAANRLASENGA